MACDERWLFRMWHLYLFLILLIFIGQHGAADAQNSPLATLNKEKLAGVLHKSSKTAESVHENAKTEDKNETIPNDSDLMTETLKPVNETEKMATESTTKPPKPMETNPTQTKAADSAQMAPTNSSVITEAAKTSPKIKDKQQTLPEKDPKIPVVTEPKKSEETELTVKSSENKTEPDNMSSLSNDSIKKTNLEPEEGTISKTPSQNVPQVPLANQPENIEDQASEGFEDTDDLHNTPFANPEIDYDGNDDNIAQKEDGHALEAPEELHAGESVVTKDESKPKAYIPKHATGSDEFDDGDSHFFIYFLTVVGMCIVMYVLFHNKQKILALIVEGRQERRRRPNTSQYRPLDNNLEEVIQAGAPKNGRLVTNIIY